MYLIVSATFPPEPVVSANLSYDIATSLAKKGNKITVLSPKPSRPYGHNFSSHDKSSSLFTHVIMKSFVAPKSTLWGRIFESISFGRACSKYIRANNPEIRNIYMNAWPIFSQFLIAREAKKYNIPIITHVQDIYPESFLKRVPKAIQKFFLMLLTPFDNYVLKNSKSIICISQNMKNYLLENRALFKTKVHVIRNWQNDQLFTAKKISGNKSINPFTFMYVGSISKSAGVDLIIHSFSSLNPELNCRLVIAGSGSERENCINISKKNSKIEFWDAPQNRIPEIQSQADILLLSLKKGVGETASPSKFTAYLFSKKPVLAAVDENSDTADCIRKANCGFIVNPEDQDGLTNIMSTLPSMPKDELSILGLNGFTFAQHNLSKKYNLEKLIKILTSVG